MMITDLSYKNLKNDGPDYTRLARIIDDMVSNWPEHPSLRALAAKAGLEPTRFQKLFTSYVGLSPKRFMDALTYRHARAFLQQAELPTLAVAYEAGLSGNGVLHDLFIKIEAATPGEVRARGAGLTIKYASVPSPYGDVLLAKTHRGLCWMSFKMQDSHDAGMERMQKLWPKAHFIEDLAGFEIEKIYICNLLAQNSLDMRKKSVLKLHLYGTNFQYQVWQALLRIPSGCFVSYEAVANAIGRPTAQRAVGSAVGANPVSLLIPCHRVIQKSGAIENYGWGPARKKALLGMEFSDTLMA